MKRRSGAGGELIKARGRKTVTRKRRNAPKAGRAHSFAASHQTELAGVIRERDEAQEQQAATSEVLQIISSSPGNLQPVFEAVLANATRLCDAAFGDIFRWEGDGLRLVATYNTPAAFAEVVRSNPKILPTVTKSPIHRADLAVDQRYLERNPTVVAAVELGGVRTNLVVPMLKENELIGTFVLNRQEVRPFTEKQIALATSFASQAVIAIENTRLLSELRASLQQQTATADVLKVISRSTFNLQTVLDSLIETAARLCEAERGVIVRRDGDFYNGAAFYNTSPELVDFVRRHPITPGRHTVTARVALERRTVHVADLQADPEYKYALRDVDLIRTELGVPMFRGGDIVGIVILYKLHVQPFTDKQIELVETFADQAVIAIENVRLFEAEQQRSSELAESLEQQTATADVLKVISRSTFDLRIVLDTLTESAARLCAAQNGVIYLRDGDLYRLAANCLRAGYRARLIAPLMRGEEIIGMLVVRRRTPGSFPQNTVDLMKSFAAQSALAIENARLFNNVEASLEDLRTAQDRLVQTERLASLGQLTAGIAHEIKNPLNFVNNFSGISVELVDELQEALAKVKADDKSRTEITELAHTLQENLNKIVQHGKRADSIVKNMLLHSREGSGEHRPVDINAIVAEAVNLAYHGARAEKHGFNITLQHSLDSAAGQVDCFPQEITRVLLNLISNGFYAATKRKGQTGDGDYEPTLAAMTRNLGDRVEIRIRDNGTGIPPEVREKMFNPFFTTKPAGEGTGLGLSISHDIIVKQHAGSIEVESQPGEFTEFRIVLPRAAASLGQSGGRA